MNDQVHRLLTRPQAARALGISERTLRQLIVRHGIELVRLSGGLPRVREADLARLIEPVTEPACTGGEDSQQPAIEQRPRPGRGPETAERPA